MKNVLKIIAILFVSCCFINNVSAASFSVSASSTSLTKGGSAKLTISGSDVTGKFSISSSNSNVVSVNGGDTWIENSSESFTLSAMGVGTATITVKPVNVSDSNGNAVSLGAKSVKITVALPREKSNNNDLGSLSVDGYEITPAFNKNTLEYSVAVPSEVSTVNINAKAADKYATVTGTGTVEVVEGSNKFDIVVTSETGKAKTYTLTVNVADNNPIEIDVKGKKYTLVKNAKSLTMPEGFTATTVNISDFPAPAFYNEALDITLIGLKDETGNIYLFIYKDGEYTLYQELRVGNLALMLKDIDKTVNHFKKSTITINDREYDCLKTNEKSAYALFYGMNLANGEEAYYLYDSKEQTLQRYDDELINELDKTLETKEKNIKLLCVIAGGILLFTIIVIIILGGRLSKLKKIILAKNVKRSKE